MFAKLKSIALAVALTFIAAAGMTVSSGIATPAPAEAGIVSGIKGAAKSVAGGVGKAAKAVGKRVVVPVGKDLYRAGKVVAKPVIKSAETIGSGLKKAWPGVKKVAKYAFPALR